MTSSNEVSVAASGAKTASDDTHLEPAHEVNSPVTHQMSHHSGKKARHDAVAGLWPGGWGEKDD